MATDKIITPRGQIFKTTNGLAKLEWNPNFQNKWQGKYNVAQKRLDNAILKDTDKYVPMLTGILKLSGRLGTVIGNGLIQYIAPYAKDRYYSKNKIGSATGGLRGPQWFERSKADNKQEWIKVVKGEMK